MKTELLKKLRARLEALEAELGTAQSGMDRMETLGRQSELIKTMQLVMDTKEEI
jgi:hypothetical protein